RDVQLCARAVAPQAARRVSGASARGHGEVSYFQGRCTKIYRRGLSIYWHGPLRAPGRRARGRASQSNSAQKFSGYTTKAGADLYGMGVSAISSIGEAYAQNDRALATYQSAVAERGLATMRG